MNFSQNDRIFAGWIPSENSEPVAVLRAGDPAANDALAAYLHNVLTEENLPEFAQDVLDLIFRFKNWQNNAKAPIVKVRSNTGLADSVRAGLEQKGGSCRRSQLLNKYRIPPTQLDRILPQLDIHEFRIATQGRPATFYVLPEAVEKFRRQAIQEGWTILANGILAKKTPKVTRAADARKTTRRGR